MRVWGPTQGQTASPGRIPWGRKRDRSVQGEGQALASGIRLSLRWDLQLCILETNFELPPQLSSGREGTGARQAPAHSA
jgi:hypothetical protein